MFGNSWVRNPFNRGDYHLLRDRPCDYLVHTGNGSGVTVCLLNRYPHAEPGWVPPSDEHSHLADPSAPNPESRGLLVRKLAIHADVRSIVRAVETTDLRAYSAFTLLAFEPDSPPGRLRWDGYELSHDTPSPPVVSSSFRGPEVTRGRIELYHATVGRNPTQEELRDYHESHAPQKGPYSVCVHRDDGGTVSLTEVVVNAQSVEMRYTPGPPCEEGALAALIIDRSSREANP